MILRLISNQVQLEDKLIVAVDASTPVRVAEGNIRRKLCIDSDAPISLRVCSNGEMDAARPPLAFESTWAEQHVTQGAVIFVGPPTMCAFARLGDGGDNASSLVEALGTESTETTKDELRLK